MKLGMIGLGKMGGDMTRRLMQHGHEVVVFDISEDAVRGLADEGAIPATSVEEMVRELEAPRVLWLMLPSGEITERSVDNALSLLEADDILVDGANSDWTDTRSRDKKSQEVGVHYVDAGVSGGVWGLREGYNLMVGGSDEAFGELEPALRALAPEGGYAHVGPTGSGHFVKMVHNGVEYALMQSYGEGFEILASYEHAELDLHKIANLWTHGSVIRSWLLDLTVSALAEDGRLEEIEAYVDDSGMGRWTVEYGVKHAVPTPAIAAALYARFSSRQEGSFAAKVAAALRNEFGGHSVKRSIEQEVERPTEHSVNRLEQEEA